MKVPAKAVARVSAKVSVKIAQRPQGRLPVKCL